MIRYCASTRALLPDALSSERVGWKELNIFDKTNTLRVYLNSGLSRQRFGCHVSFPSTRAKYTMAEFLP